MKNRLFLIIILCLVLVSCSVKPLREQYTPQEFKERLISIKDGYDPLHFRIKGYSIFGASGKLYYIDDGWKDEETGLLNWNYMTLSREDAIDIILGVMLSRRTGDRTIKDRQDYLFVKDILESCTDRELEAIFCGQTRVHCWIEDESDLKAQKKAYITPQLRKDIEWIKTNIWSNENDKKPID